MTYKSLTTLIIVSMLSLLLTGCGANPVDPDDGDDDGDNGGNPAVKRTLTVNTTGQGTVTPDAGDYNDNQQLEITATPAEGYRFVRWQGDLTGNRFDHWMDRVTENVNPSTLTMDADKTITAVFAERNVTTETLDLGNDVILKVVNVAGGTFIMGSTQTERDAFILPGINFDDEAPQHDVTVSSFAIGETEVTQAQFNAVMGYVPTPPDGATHAAFNSELGDNRPAVWVTWPQAVEFCQALTDLTGRYCRLPTEAEWEYACRAGTTTAFCCGDTDEDLADYAWFNQNGSENAHDVAGKLPNAFGLYDMHGNVWEWTGNWFDLYTADDQNDPTGPGKPAQKRKVTRGGAYSRAPWALRSAYRYDGYNETQAEYNIGFRIVCE